LKTRLLGAFVLIALMVLFVPMFFSSTPPTTAGDQAVSLAIPPAPDRDLQTRTMSLNPDAPASAASGVSPASTAPVIPASTQSAAAAPSDRVATVDIASRRPRDVELEPNAGTSASPVIPAKVAPPAPEPAAQPKPASPVDDTAGTAARGSYSLNLSAYSSAGAQRLMQKVRALGYPVAGRPVSQGGKTLTLVTAGPFQTRTTAEAARLKITQSIPGAPAHLESGASDQHGDVAAAPASAPAQAGGYAVQVAAMGSQADANALRDKLRAAGFDGFVDTVTSGGRQLWRVRAGPQTQRADAERVRDQIKARLGMAGNVVSVP
jgi:cell division septation protein DedD